MKKVIGLITCLLLIFSNVVFAADTILTFRIPEAKAQAALVGFIRSNPNEIMIPDPEWVDPEDGSEAPFVKKYTNLQWVKVVIRNWAYEEIQRGRKALQEDAISIEADNELITVD